MVTGASLLAEIQQLQSKKRLGAVCTVALLRASLSKEEKEALDLACRDLTLDSVTISTWLEKKGHSVRSWTINRHRRNQCSCAR